MKKAIFVAIFCVLCIISTSIAAFACACCAEPGTYSVSTGLMASYELDLLKDMKFGPAADLYLTAAGYEDLKGMPAVIKEFETTTSSEFALTDIFTGKAWTLNFMTEGELKGSLVLPR